MPIRTVKKISIPITNSSVGRGAGAVAVPLIAQEQTKWCWAACMEMILTYYGNTTLKQCHLANTALGKTTCCQSPMPYDCNQTLTDSKISALFGACGLSASYMSSSVPYPDIDFEITAGRPVEVAFSWHGGGGHVAVIVETTIMDDVLLVTLNDPGYGIKTVSYDALQKGYGFGVWDATWTSIK